MGYLRCLVSSTVKERTSRMRRLNRFEIDWRGKLTGWSAPPGVNTGRLAGRLHCGGDNASDRGGRSRLCQSLSLPDPEMDRLCVGQ